ncbi:HAMP domain-containing histidine kinase [Calothrix sp. FACHB-1219]|uniref:sensor histidine kinase n=1 Tax=unclassified Calothrix TaxID=2619626 RepID=UPI0016838316|nr:MULTISPECIES: HAMP domain-containing sensor histidine kinase [unclassified Calothrix]MBD2208228.1 HAMP domain-containing histidine kinase [Calothrix sp. FACHB-168]MBD2222781.1 HAMP domain-containing histidine kinase [Calothrix sp. FACHB-1219]
MNWSNWVYLGLGLALGVSFRWFWGRSSKGITSSSLVATTESKSVDDSVIETTQKPEIAPESLTQLRQSLQETQLAYAMAKEMSQFKAGFLARTTHELRSPLNGLIGLHQLILTDLCENPEEEREFVAQAHERALKLLKLIDEILNVARVEHGTNKLDIQPLSLAEVLQEVDKLTHMLAANRNYPLQISPPDSETYVLADPRWLRQILVTLIDTAIAQMEEGSISLTTATAGNIAYIWLDVPVHALPGSESIDFIKSIEFIDTEDKSVLMQKNQPNLSPGMKLLLNQTLLEAMGGKLEIVPPSTELETTEFTRLQLSIPLAIAEVEFLPSLEN